MTVLRRILASFAVVALTACGAGQSPPVKSLILATTGSAQDSGLLSDLLPVFTTDTGWQVTPLAVGSGQAIDLGRRGEADVLLVHSPEAEAKFVAEGTAGQRRLVMHNDYVIAGPPGDPAGIKGMSAVQAMTKIVTARAAFISRGDESGTHAREKQLWQQAGVTPAGPSYRTTGQGMGVTLRVASEASAYTLADRATYVTQTSGLTLDVLSEGDKALLNLYHVIEMTTRAGDRVNPDGAKAFADWLVGPHAQDIIGRFGTDKAGRPLFIPDAGKDARALGG